MSRILLVEDNEMNRDMLSRRLSRKGYEVSIAIDGQQGLAMSLRGGFDLVLLDMSLPEMDGWEVARRLRADPRTRSLPIIATRGCPYVCTFCSSPQMWGVKYNMRDPKDVIDEVAFLVDDVHGTTHIPPSPLM